MVKKYVLVLLTFFVSGCFFDPGRLVNKIKGVEAIITSRSTGWDMIENADDGPDPFVFRNKQYPNIFVSIYVSSPLYENLLKKKWCYLRKEDENRNYAIAIRIILAGREYFDEQVYFNPDKIYYIKDGSRIDIGLSRGYRNILKNRLSETIVKDSYYISEKLEKDGHALVVYKSPLICGELENTELVFDGLTINGKATPPIKVHIKFKDPTLIPLYVPPEKK